MLKRIISNCYELTIDDGDVAINGHKVGRLERYLKFGYHPTVRLFCPMGLFPELEKIWELDDQDIVEDCVKTIDEHIRKFDAAKT